MTLHLLRNTRALRAWLLVAFACAVLAAGVSPWMRASSDTLPFAPVCRAHAKVGAEPRAPLVVDAPAGDAEPTLAAAMTCPLCMPLSMLPPSRVAACEHALPDDATADTGVVNPMCIEPILRPSARAPPFFITASR